MFDISSEVTSAESTEVTSEDDTEEFLGARTRFWPEKTQFIEKR